NSVWIASEYIGGACDYNPWGGPFFSGGTGDNLLGTCGGANHGPGHRSALAHWATRNSKFTPQPSIHSKPPGPPRAALALLGARRVPPVPRRRRQQVGLQRVLGAPGLFATVYGNVGSSIYYALGVTAAFALGLTPLVFVVAGVIFAATTMTYAEGTV